MHLERLELTLILRIKPDMNLLGIQNHAKACRPQNGGQTSQSQPYIKVKQAVIA